MDAQQKQHEEALRNPSPGFERGIVTLWQSLAELADAHFKRYNEFISEDYYIGEEWSKILEAAENLLNGETGRISCGEFSRQINDLRSSGGSPVAIEQARAAVAPKAVAKQERVTVAPIGTKRLDERQRDLLSLIRVTDNVANYTGTGRIPDWAALKSVMIAIGGKWAKKGFVFPDDIDAKEAVRLAYETGEIIDPKAAEFFETPPELAGALADWVDASEGESVLEPSAGRGALVKAVKARSPQAELFVCEALDEHRRILADELGCSMLECDFMDLASTETFDHVIMNPPFSKRQDVKHITKAIGHLEIGGRLAAIASAGVLYRDDKIGAEFRALIESHGGVIEKNPEGSFKSAGTGVATVSIFLTKR